MGDVYQGRLVPTWPTKFYIDASLPQQVRYSLHILRRDVVIPDSPDCPIVVGDDDEIWLPIVGQNDWLAIMRDKHIRYRSAEKRALLENGVRAFCLTGSAGNWSMWQMTDLIVRKWDQFEQKGQTEAGPFLYAVTYDPQLRRIL